jgi:hypothetical protein
MNTNKNTQISTNTNTNENTHINTTITTPPSPPQVMVELYGFSPESLKSMEFCAEKCKYYEVMCTDPKVSTVTTTVTIIISITSTTT